MRRLPIRIRITLTFAAVMAVVLTAVGLFLYTRMEAQLNDQIDSALRSRATEVAALAHDAGGRLSQPDADPLIEHDESFAQVVTDTGGLIDSSPQLRGTQVLSPPELARARDGVTIFERSGVTGLEGNVRLLAAPVEARSGMVVVVVGSSLGDRDEALASLAKLLAIGGPIALLLASLAGYWMAGAALRPVDSMRRRAAEISASAPGERLPVPQSRDELSRLGETLNAMLARLELALERERRFVDDASHELRTPLALHRIELELALRHAASEEELREAIASATEEIDRLINLAEDLLVVARAGNGDGEVKSAPFEVEDAFEAIRARFTARAEWVGTEIDYEKPVAMEIQADRSRIERALTNLVENALRHGRGPVRLEARAANGQVELHVMDSGDGFPAEFLDQAFERFSRADGARTDGGTGLGLAIVDTVARAHGGSAHARNRPEGGADVWISVAGAKGAGGPRSD